MFRIKTNTTPSLKTVSLSFKGRYIKMDQSNAIICCKCCDRRLSRGPWKWQRGSSSFSPIATQCSTHPYLLDEWIKQKIAWNRRFWWEQWQKERETIYPSTVYEINQPIKLNKKGMGLHVSENNPLKLDIDIPWSWYCIFFCSSS